VAGHCEKWCSDFGFHETRGIYLPAEMWSGFKCFFSIELVNAYCSKCCVGETVIDTPSRYDQHSAAHLT